MTALTIHDTTSTFNAVDDTPIIQAQDTTTIRSIPIITHQVSPSPSSKISLSKKRPFLTSQEQQQQKNHEEEEEDKERLFFQQHKFRPYDILCGRHKHSFNNIGNRRFRITISLNLERYSAAKSRKEKGQVVKFVTQMLIHDVGARFLKQNSRGDWVELDIKGARSKVGHALRDMRASQERCRQRDELVDKMFNAKKANANGDLAIIPSQPEPEDVLMMNIDNVINSIQRYPG